MPSLAVGAYRYVESLPAVSEMVSDGLLGADTAYPAWVFRSSDGKPERNVEGSGKCAIVITQTGHWALQNMHNTAQFPTLSIIIYADHSRDDRGRITRKDAGDKCLEIYNRLNPFIHDPAHNITDMGGVRIHNITSGGAFQLVEMLESEDEAVYGIAFYNIVTD